MRYPSNEANKVKPGCRFFNKRQLSDYIGISINTVSAWVSQKRIPFVKLGGWKVMFDKNDIDKWIERQKKSPCSIEGVDIL